jgi:hypothetical protein
MKLFIDIHYKDFTANIYSESVYTVISFGSLEELAEELMHRIMVRTWNDDINEYTYIQIHELYIEISNVGHALCHLLDRKGIKYRQVNLKEFEKALPVILK